MATAPTDDAGVEDAAILLMSLGEEEAAEVFKHLAPKEVQRLGETIAKLKTIPRERVDGVLDKFNALAGEQSMLVTDTDEYVKSVLRKALGEDKANLLIDRILQGADVTGIESLKWMDPGSVAELLRAWRQVGFRHGLHDRGAFRAAAQRLAADLAPGSQLSGFRHDGAGGQEGGAQALGCLLQAGGDVDGRRGVVPGRR